MSKNFTLLLLFSIYQLALMAQQPPKPTSGEIFKSIQKLNFLGNALFVAAHPDDENTRLISYLVNELNAHTTYLSLTRGDGGQNLIGPEIEELLGVIRTQELLQARKVDGGNQMFTRANDFGFSKNAEETINIWDNEQVKHDVVWAIRNTRPDVIINRFDHRTSGTTHGHHTASAILATELFEKAGDKTSYSDQLKSVKEWKAQRLFFNISWFFFGSQEAFNKADKSGFLSFDVGGYYPLLGKSNTEIAALSRSKHKCQGFGSTGSRGTQQEYLELIKGDMPPSKSNIFEGINTTWTRVKGGKAIQTILQRVENNFNYAAPQKSIPDLLLALALIEKIDDDFWRNRKTEEIKNIILNCLGVYYDATTTVHTAVPGEKITIDIEAVKRMPGDVILQSIQILPNGKDTTFIKKLLDNENFLQSYSYTIDQNEPFTNAYWLNSKGTKGMYSVDKKEWIGKPETPHNLKVAFHFLINGKKISVTRTISHRFNSPEDGETYRPLEITPEVFINVAEKVYVFGNQEPRKVKVIIKAGAGNQKGMVSIPLPATWSASPKQYDFEIKDKNDSEEFVFEITPPTDEAEITINPTATVNGKKYYNQLIQINYDHIPYQLITQPAEAKLVKLNIKKAGKNIVYIPGAGDEVAVSLRQIGYNVTEIEAKNIDKESLSKADAVVLGVRAYNTNEDLKYKQDIIMDYVKNGGTAVAQYNTNNRLVVGQSLGPYPIKIGRDRVTVEEVPIRILTPEHEIINQPNKINSKDFDGWIQERGLYFATEWAKEYTPILSCNDPGEEPKDGGLLVAKHGSGYFIYTGYSWFRQLPAGVAGAYRLFANIVSLGHQPKP